MQIEQYFFNFVRTTFLQNIIVSCYVLILPFFPYLSECTELGVKIICKYFNQML